MSVRMICSANKPGSIAVVIPFFNEERYLASTLASLAAQVRPPDRVILVDNASTDGSAPIAAAFVERNPDLNPALLSESRPGKASALAAGLARVEEEFVATCDADTYYPPLYLAVAERLLAAGADAAIAFGVPREASVKAALLRAKGAVAAALAPGQTHGGGYGQSFRMTALLDAGGFSAERWGYCLMDHEIMHRIVARGGRLGYAFDHWCAPSPRRRDRRSVRWTLSERLFYHVIPRARRDWFFYEFLAPRFAERKLGELALRQKTWEDTIVQDEAHAAAFTASGRATLR
jgi:glycosyltransferase involved in cell wall biosynthesis